MIANIRMIAEPTALAAGGADTGSERSSRSQVDVADTSTPLQLPRVRDISGE